MNRYSGYYTLILKNSLINTTLPIQLIEPSKSVQFTKTLLRPSFQPERMNFNRTAFNQECREENIKRILSKVCEQIDFDSYTKKIDNEWVASQTESSLRTLRSQLTPVQIPGQTECCMSNCIKCVWDKFEAEFDDYKQKIILLTVAEIILRKKEKK
jgi:hypothetical protein